MTNIVFPNGTTKTQQTIALAFAVASLQNPGMEGFHSLPQALLDAAASSSSIFPSAQPMNHNNNNTTTKEQLLQRKTQSHDRKEDTKSSSSTRSLPLVQMHHQRVDANGGDEHDVEEEGEDEEELVGDDSERRLARSRERNREHARRTRLRKKAQLEALQVKVKRLEAERQVLKQKVEECGIASILLGLSSGGTRNNGHFPAVTQSVMEESTLSQDKEQDAVMLQEENTERRSDMVAVLSGVKRKRFISEAIGEQTQLQQEQQQHRLTIEIDGVVTEIGTGKSHMNWKTGLYRDHNGVQRQLTTDQLDDLRRERNRIHAKMTRSRKKCFIATIQKAITELEEENGRMKDILDKVAPPLSSTSSYLFSSSSLSSSSSCGSLSTSSVPQVLVTPAVSPALSATPAPAPPVMEESSNLSSSHVVTTNTSSLMTTTTRGSTTPAVVSASQGSGDESVDSRLPFSKRFKTVALLQNKRQQGQPAPQSNHGFGVYA